MRPGKSYLKCINFILCLARSLQNHVYSTSSERPPVLRDHKVLVVALYRFHCISHKANLRDLIAATGVVILVKLDSNRQFFSPCDLEI